MRARSLKPALFKNELLGTADPLCTLLFEGLWCAADREGRLEDRPLRIKAEVFPYRGVDIEVGLNWLKESGFIDRYEAQGIAVIQIVKFSEHQHPHRNETASVLPAKAGQGRAKVRRTSDQGAKADAPSTTPLGLTPSSLTPDSLNLTPDCLSDATSAQGAKNSTAEARAPARRPTEKASRLPDDFELTPKRRAFADQHELAPEPLFAQFCDHWRAKSGKAGIWDDWEAVWRNWVRREAKWLKQSPGGQRGQQQQDTNVRAAVAFVNGGKHASG